MPVQLRGIGHKIDRAKGQRQVLVRHRDRRAEGRRQPQVVQIPRLPEARIISVRPTRLPRLQIGIGIDGGSQEILRPVMAQPLPVAEFGQREQHVRPVIMARRLRAQGGDGAVGAGAPQGQKRVAAQHDQRAVTGPAALQGGARALTVTVHQRDLPHADRPRTARKPRQRQQAGNPGRATRAGGGGQGCARFGPFHGARLSTSSGQWEDRMGRRGRKEGVDSPAPLACMVG
ncbi:hypothetical protein SXCC_02521 [Gluconacetobacter sp. SXCC-1]|nr:hypothetical protein SXCC_02521 [Gluconacetobacter sp. SXCC-1]